MSPMIQNSIIRETLMHKTKEVSSPRSSDEEKPPQQVLEPEDSGPKLNVEGLISNAFPEKVMEIEVL